MKKYELIPGRFDSRKSFYRKALVIESDNGETLLQSYNTIVCKITKNGRFVRLWDGYSATTMRHINAFTGLFNISGSGKKWWMSQPVESIGEYLRLI